MDFPLYLQILLGQWEGVILEMQYKLFSSATKTMGDSNFPNRPALGQLHLIE